MAKEVLAVPEEHLAEVIKVIRLGLEEAAGTIDPDVSYNLDKWCDDEEEYLKRLEQE